MSATVADVVIGLIGDGINDVSDVLCRGFGFGLGLDNIVEVGGAMLLKIPPRSDIKSSSFLTISWAGDELLNRSGNEASGIDGWLGGAELTFKSNSTRPEKKTNKTDKSF